MDKTCVYCGEALAENASICKACGHGQMPRWFARFISAWGLRELGAGTLLAALAWGYAQWSTYDGQRREHLTGLMQSGEILQATSEQLRLPCSGADCRNRFENLVSAFSNNHYQFTHAARYFVADEKVRAAIDFIDDFYNPGSQKPPRHISDFSVLPLQEAILRARDALETPYADSSWCTEDRREALRSLTESMDIYRYCKGAIQDYAEDQATSVLPFTHAVSPGRHYADCSSAPGDTVRTTANILASMAKMNPADYSAPWLFDTYCAGSGLAIGGGLIPPRTGQMLVVESAGWQSTSGTLSAYQRQGDTWIRADHPPIPVMLGKAGLGWASGLLPIPMAVDAAPGTPFKHEGDERAPAGLFALGAVYTDPSAPAAHLKMPVVTTNDQMYCDDRVDSPTYNTPITLSPKDLAACSRDELGCPSERLRRTNEGVYKRFVWIKYNASPVVKSAGSCIFLHLNHADKQPSVGCTTLSPDDMNWLLAWLDASQHPLLLQLPKEELDKRAARLGLPH